VRRGEKQPIHVLNGQMRGEAEYNWWRFIPHQRGQTEGRRKLAMLFRHYRMQATERAKELAAKGSFDPREVYDIWKLNAMGVVYSGVMA
jgi:hypothetical protein